jgi:hypothetical protein
MPGLLGYMVAIVLTLGGYLAGLHWLVNPPDPWQPNPKIAQIAQPTPKKRLPPVKTPSEAGAPAALPQPASELASLEPSMSVQTTASETVRATGLNRVDITRPAEKPGHILRRAVSVPKTTPGDRRRADGNPGRKLQLMVLRTYERSDGKRFSRLLPLSSARTALAFEPGGQW